MKYEAVYTVVLTIETKNRASAQELAEEIYFQERTIKPARRAKIRVKSCRLAKLEDAIDHDNKA